MGAHFAKWRAVIAVGDGLPSRGYLEAAAHALARYAGASGIDLPQASSGGRGGRRHGEVCLPAVPAAVPGICILLGRPIRLNWPRPVLNALNVRFTPRTNLGVAVCQRLEQPALKIWQGKEAPRVAARKSSVSSSQLRHGLRAASNTIPRWKGDASMTTRIAQLEET